MEHELLTGLRNYIAQQLVQPVQVEISTAYETANHYVDILLAAGFDFTKLHEFRNEPVQEMYGHLLDSLRILPFERYPIVLSKSHLDTHLNNIARLSLNYFATTECMGNPKQTSVSNNLTVNNFDTEGTPGETMPEGGNTTDQLPQRKYICVSVTVATVPVDDQRVVWHISTHVPELSEQENPDYECLIIPHALQEKSPEMLAHLGFDYGVEDGMLYHQEPEFGRRKLEHEEIGLEKFTNYLYEIRNGLHGAGPNNGLILFFETSEELALVNHLLSCHNYHIFLDLVKGVSCLDHYLLITYPKYPTTYRSPVFQHPVGHDGCWMASVSISNKLPQKIHAKSKPECLFFIFQAVLGAKITYNQFIKWYSYPVNHPIKTRMLETLDHIIELLPLQHYIDQQLFVKKVPVVLKGIYEACNEVEALYPYNACARQTIRRLVILNYTLDVLTKMFKKNPKDILRSWILLQADQPILRLRLHSQTVQICDIIKEYFVRAEAACPNSNPYRKPKN